MQPGLLGAASLHRIRTGTAGGATPGCRAAFGTSWPWLGHARCYPLLCARLCWAPRACGATHTIHGCRLCVFEPSNHLSGCLTGSGPIVSQVISLHHLKSPPEWTLLHPLMTVDLSGGREWVF